MQSIDLLSVHGYNFVNFREIEMLLSLLGIPVTLEKALSAPKLGRCEFLPIFNSSIAVLRYDSFQISVTKDITSII